MSLPPPPPYETIWKPLEEMYELFEPAYIAKRKRLAVGKFNNVPPPPTITLPLPPTDQKHKKIPPAVLRKKSTPPPHMKKRTKKTKALPPSVTKKDSYKVMSPEISTTSPGANGELAVVCSSFSPPAVEHEVKINNLAKVVSFDTISNDVEHNAYGRQTRTMTLSKPQKLESLNKDEFLGKYLIESNRIIGQFSYCMLYVVLVCCLCMCVEGVLLKFIDAKKRIMI